MGSGTLTRRTALVATAATAALASVRGTAQADDPTTLGIAEAGRHLKSGTLSSVDLTQAYLDRIRRLDPQINAYITVTAESALAEARTAATEIAAGRYRGPLHGVPIALKDNIDTAGVRTTAASRVYADRVPDADAEVVRRLKDAGAVFLGKLNMHEFAYGGTTAITLAGPTRNPWNLAHHPGGSSGGAAAAVAARLCAGALGTDTAASIRLPASFCGVTGFKASHGLASVRGIVPLSETHDHVGPICRSVEDCALLMDAIAGFDPLDPVSIRSVPQHLGAAIGRDVSGLRIGVARVPYFEDLDPDVDAAMGVALKALRGLVVGMREVELTSPDSYPVLAADAYAYHAAFVANEARRSLYHPTTLARIMDGSGISTTTYIEGRRRMAIARNTADRFFADVDLIVSPTCMVLPDTIENVLAGKSLPSDLPLIRNTLPCNVLGIPSISVPCGSSAAGLPIGLMISGPPRGEGQVLALAHAWQQATGWNVRRPPIG
jgi:aspartyl-tRNA(Asn)/glutamyl-tRNA(Gln) amidotransferase subunit A